MQITISSTKRPLVRYGFAIAVVIAAFLVRRILEWYAGGSLPTFLTFYPALMLAALYAGFRAGVIATVCTGIIASYWVLPPEGFGVESLSEIISLIFFTGVGISLSWVADRYIHNRQKAANYEKELAVQAERKWAEEELLQSQRDLNRAQSVAHTGSWRLNVKENQLLWSDETYRIFGIPEGTPMTYDSFLAGIHPEDRDYVDRKWAAALLGETYDIEHRIIVGDTTKWVHERAELEFNSQGQLLGGFGTVQDITGHKQMDEALREREQRFRSAFDGAVPMTMTALDSRLIIVNSAYSRMLGYSESELAGMNFYDITHPDDLAANKAGIDQVVTGKKDSFRMEKRYIRKDGQVVWVDMSTSSVRDDGCKPLYLVTHAQNITKRKEAEEALRRSESLLRTIVDNSPDPIFMKDSSGRMLLANPATLAARGKSAEEVIGKTDLDFSDDPEIGRTMMENDRLIMETGQRNVFEERVNHPDGPHIFLSTKAPLHDSNGNVYGLIGIARDITERKRAEEQLRQREVEFRTLAENSPDSIGRLDADLKHLYVNPVARRMSGMDITGKTWREAGLPEDFVNFWEEKLKEVIGTGKMQILEHSYQTDEGLKYLSSRIVPEFKDNGTVGSVLIITTDITKQKETEWKLEEKVRERTALLSETNKSLVAEVAERKRTEGRLLSAQKRLRAMASEIVFADERTRQHFATDLHDTVVQTLGAAKLRSQLIEGQIPPEAKPVYTEVQNMISQSITQSRLIMAELSPPVLYELGFVPALEWLTEQVEAQHDIPITFRASDDPQPLTHELQVLLFQATRELLMNIVKHSKAGSAFVNFSANADKIRIEVADNGTGFNSRQAFRTDTSSGGFGLFSIRERLRHFDGQLTIKSEPGKGTRVVMTVPRSME